MNAALSAEVTGAATEAEGILGETFQYPPGTGAIYTGVFGTSQIVEIMMPGGGYRRRSEIPLSVTQAQTGFNPVSKTTLLRLRDDTLFRIEKINDKDALSYTLDLVKIGD